MEDQLNTLLWSFISHLIFGLELHGASQIMLNGGLVQIITLSRPVTQLLLLNTSFSIIAFTLKGTYDLIFLFFSESHGFYLLCYNVVSESINYILRQHCHRTTEKKLRNGRFRYKRSLHDFF